MAVIVLKARTNRLADLRPLVANLLATIDPLGTAPPVSLYYLIVLTIKRNFPEFVDELVRAY
jgi:hypothetical protein